jgi:preprotein translocase subunit SecF
VSVEAKFPKAVEVEKVRSALQGAGFNEPEVQSFGSSQDVRIRLPPITGQGGDVIRARIDTALKGLDPGAQIAQLEVVGPQVGAELRTSAIQALSFTVLFIFIYLALRFHTWRLSAGAILAVLHDPILVLGVFSLTKTPFDLAVVAAILAVIGYSLNDTVVVFDRIRENLRRYKRMPMIELLNLSINETLSRTVLTSVTTALAVLALYIFGTAVIHGFSFAMLFGIVIGTYSSIFVAAPFLLLFGVKREWSGTVTKEPAKADARGKPRRENVASK